MTPPSTTPQVQDGDGRRLTPEPAGGATPPSPQAVLAEGAHQAQGWQPIETAPHDGTRLLLWTDTRAAPPSVIEYIKTVCEGEHFAECQIGYWEDAVDAPLRVEPAGWRHDLIGAPTHWMPLPPPPVSA